MYLIVFSNSAHFYIFFSPGTSLLSHYRCQYFCISSPSCRVDLTVDRETPEISSVSGLKEVYFTDTSQKFQLHPRCASNRSPRTFFRTAHHVFNSTQFRCRFYRIWIKQLRKKRNSTINSPSDSTTL